MPLEDKPLPAASAQTERAQDDGACCIEIPVIWQ